MGSWMFARRLPALVARSGAVRGLAKKAAGGNAPAFSPKTKIPTAELEATVRGLNIFKGGSDQETLPDSEYPEWVFELHKPQPDLDTLMSKYNVEGPEALTEEEQRRLIKRWNKKRIKDNNDRLEQ